MPLIQTTLGGRWGFVGRSVRASREGVEVFEMAVEAVSNPNRRPCPAHAGACACPEGDGGGGGKGGKARISVFLDAPDAATYSAETGPSTSFTIQIHDHLIPNKKLSKGERGFDSQYEGACSRPLRPFSSLSEAKHMFTSEKKDWGFSEFAPRKAIFKEANDYLVNDRLILSVDLTVERKLGTFQLDTGRPGFRRSPLCCHVPSTQCSRVPQAACLAT
jgi:hypothetical protein